MSKVLSIILSAVVLAVTHLLLLNFIESKKRRVPSQNLSKMLFLSKKDKLLCKKIFF